MNIFIISLIWGLVTFYIFGEVVALRTISLNKLKYSYLQKIWFCLFMGLVYVYLGLIYGLVLGLIGGSLKLILDLSYVNILSVYTGLSVAVFGYFLTKWQITDEENIQIATGLTLGILSAFLYKFYLHSVITEASIYWLFLIFAPAVFLSFTVGKKPSQIGTNQTRINTNQEQESSLAAYDVNKKTVFIGIDALEPRLLNKYLKEGKKLPNFKKLIENGTYTNLKSIHPTTSPIIWNSIFTGKRPERHGILHWYKVKFPFLPEIEKFRPMEYPKSSRADRTIRWLIARGIVKRILYTAKDRKEKAFWNILSDFGKYSVNLGWMVSWPAEPIKGIQVSCYMYPHEETTQEVKRIESSKLPKKVYPEKMYHELKDYIVRVNDLSNEDLKKVNFTIAKVDYYKGFEEKLNPWDYAKDKTFLSIAHHLIDKKTDFDLFSLFLYGVDSACHTYWPFLEEATNTEKYIEEVMSLSDDPKFIEDSKGFSECIPKYYEFVDEELGKLLKKIDDDCNIIIISDHGFDLDGTQHSFSPDGLLIASSPYIKKDAKLENPSIYNILPTLLALLGVPVGQDFEKDVLSGLLTEDFLRKYLPKYISSHKHYGKKMKKEDTSLDKETEQVMKKRLRALGYIE